MRFRKSIGAILALPLVAAAPSPGPAESPHKLAPLTVAVRPSQLPQSAVPVQRFLLTANAEARAFMREQMATKHIPGAQIAVVQHGHIILLEAFGIANLEHRVAVTEDTVFPINSATKSFTGVAAMQLVEAGKLGSGLID